MKAFGWATCPSPYTKKAKAREGPTWRMSGMLMLFFLELVYFYVPSDTTQRVLRAHSSSIGLTNFYRLTNFPHKVTCKDRKIQ